jgi:hypothetical protein
MGDVTFEDALNEPSNTNLQNHVPAPTGTAWSKLEDTSGTSNLEVGSTNDAVHSTANFTGRLLYSRTPNPTTPDVDNELTFDAVETVGGRPALLLCRIQDASNYYWAAAYAATDSPDVKIGKCVAGVRTLLTSGNIGPAAADVFKFKPEGSTLKLFRNGSEVLSTTDSAIAVAGPDGIGLGNATDNAADEVRTAWELDDPKTTEYPAAPPPPSGTELSAAMKAELQKLVPVVYPILEMAWPNGTKRYGGVASTARGLAEPKVVDRGWPDITRSIDVFSGELSDMGGPVLLADYDRSIEHILLTYRNAVRGIDATIRLVSPNVADVDSFAVSLVLKSYRQAGPFTWELELGPDDQVLQQGDSPKAPLASYFPSIHDDVRAYRAPFISGEHDSNGSGNKGFIPAYLVDTVGSRYALSLGALKAVNAVYEADVIVPTSEYAIVKETRKGATFTLIDFTAVREGAITADVEGLTASTAGSGSMVVNAAALKAWLVNFVWGDWRSGTTYLADSSAPLETTSFTDVDTFLTLMGHESSMWVGGEEPRRAADVFREWLESHEVKPYWTWGGQLAIGIIDHRPPDSIYLSDPWIKQPETSEFSYSYEHSFLAREVAVSFVKNANTGEFLQTYRFQDVTVTDKIVVSLQLHNAAARVV